MTDVQRSTLGTANAYWDSDSGDEDPLADAKVLVWSDGRLGAPEMVSVDVESAAEFLNLVSCLGVPHRLSPVN